ncbi:MAG: hypothetical protein KHY79_08125 [Clostridiales bacterium]|nr:hypothetical protein [Clostridiales bacterium]
MMIKEYIEERKVKNLQRKSELEKKYSQLSEEEKKVKLEISKTKEEMKMEYDLFSPRSFERMANVKIFDMEEELKNIILKKQEIKRQIKEKERMMKKIEQMESEITDIETDEKISLSKDKVGEIVGKLDECLNLMYNDRNTCKSELKQVKKYLKSFM